MSTPPRPGRRHLPHDAGDDILQGGPGRVDWPERQELDVSIALIGGVGPALEVEWPERQEVSIALIGGVGPASEKV